MADVTVTPANVVLVSGARISGRVSGSAVVAGQAVRIDAATGRLVPAQSDSATNANAVGIALNSAPGANQPVDYAADTAVINSGGTLVVGHTYYVGTTAGVIKPAGDIAGTEFATCLGIAVTTANLLIKTLPAGAVAGAAIT